MLELVESINVAMINVEGHVAGWHANCLSTIPPFKGSGSAISRDTAIRISVAEVLERASIAELMKVDQLKIASKLDQYPTSCGFAAGFDPAKTRVRSIAEACERWVWSKWIDDHYQLAEVSPKRVVMSSLAQAIARSFEGLRFFTSHIDVAVAERVIPMKVGIVLAYVDGGVFPGSRVGSYADDLWTHSLSEAWRNRQIFNVLKKSGRRRTDLERRIEYFGTNSSAADFSISLAKRKVLPTAKVMLSREYPTVSSGFLWRSLCKDYVGWHLGADNRFVY